MGLAALITDRSPWTRRRFDVCMPQQREGAFEMTDTFDVNDRVTVIDGLSAGKTGTVEYANHEKDAYTVRLDAGGCFGFTRASNLSSLSTFAAKHSRKGSDI